MLAWPRLCLTAEEELASAESEQPPGHVLRPLWLPGKSYRMQQRLDARATIAGLGKQVLEWRQKLRITPQTVPAGYQLEIGVDNLRVDLDLGGRRSRYYFEPGTPLQYQGLEGIQGALLSRVERLVKARYLLSSNPITGQEDIQILPAEGTEVTNEQVALDEGLAAFPWQAVTSALLHQGIPEHPLSPGDAWEHIHELAIPNHGVVAVDLACQFKAFTEIKNQQYALIECHGAIHGSFRQQLPEQAKLGPGVSLDAPKVKGLTLIDPVQRTIASTVLKIEGKLTSLGLPGTEEGETAPINKTLTLTLLAIDDAKP